MCVCVSVIVDKDKGIFLKISKKNNNFYSKILELKKHCDVEKLLEKKRNDKIS